MVTVEREITKEEYDNIKSQPDICKAIGEMLPIEIHCGYGYYNGWLKEEAGKYYMCYDRGSSCD